MQFIKSLFFVAFTAIFINSNAQIGGIGLPMFRHIRSEIGKTNTIAPDKDYYNATTLPLFTAIGANMEKSSFYNAEMTGMFPMIWLQHYWYTNNEDDRASSLTSRYLKNSNRRAVYLRMFSLEQSFKLISFSDNIKMGLGYNFEWNIEGIAYPDPYITGVGTPSMYQPHHRGLLGGNLQLTYTNQEWFYTRFAVVLGKYTGGSLARIQWNNLIKISDAYSINLSVSNTLKSFPNKNFSNGSYNYLTTSDLKVKTLEFMFGLVFIPESWRD